MDAALINIIKKEYNIKNPVFLKKFESRGERHVFLIGDNKKKFVFKVILREKELAARINFISAINDKNFNIPGVVKTKSGKNYLLRSDKLLFLSEFINQKENFPSAYFFQKLGCAVGAFHNIKIKGNKIPNLNIKGKVKKLRSLFLKKETNKKTKEEMVDFFDLFPLLSGSTSGLVHGDISYFNVLGKKIFLLLILIIYQKARLLMILVR